VSVAVCLRNGGAAVVQIKIRESGLEDFQCSVDEKVGSALLYLRKKKHFQGGLIYSHDEPLDCELTFRRRPDDER
jgi:hypothetical protein